MSLKSTDQAENTDADGANHPDGFAALAAAAGIADTGSCISLVRQRNGDGSERHRLVLHITRNESHALESFHAAVGVAGAIRQIRIGHLAYWRLAYEGRKAFEVIKRIQPHLRERQLEAAAAVRYWEHGKHGAAFGPAGVPPDIKAIRQVETERFESLKAGLRMRARKPSAARAAVKQ